jgi:putative ribosome biogenesis GTPase RsgA
VGNTVIVRDGQGEPVTDDLVSFEVESQRGEDAPLYKATSGSEGGAVVATLARDNVLELPKVANETAERGAHTIFFKGGEKACTIDGIVGLPKV